MASRAMLRAACVIAAVLGGCTAPPQEQKAPEAAAAPAPKPAVAAAPAAVPPSAAAETPPRPAPKPRAPAKKRPPKPKPAPVVVAPPPPAPPPQPSPEEERKRKLDAYIAAIGRSGVAFNPPSPVQVGQSVAVTLTVNPPAEAAQLAEELRKSLEAGAPAWTPRMRARLSGGDFAIEPEGKNVDGAKDLSARIEWRWAAVPGVPGSKTLVAALSYDLPQSLGGARDLPPLQREVMVEATLSWRASQLWADYWLWILVALAVAAAIGFWAWRR
jgi:hypothetical protein